MVKKQIQTSKHASDGVLVSKLCLSASTQISFFFFFDGEELVDDKSADKRDKQSVFCLDGDRIVVKR